MVCKQVSERITLPIHYYFRGALATIVYYLPKAKSSQENFHDKLKNHKSLAQ